ncbi:glyoxalase [Aquimarina sp. 2201CG5-10]|uniref:glyoxalase n=1 Tax=Aquimarina callyspongiae TaxID=3098150 RepID=UPI002AB460F9|nr:glyoxalase [Aquimarina sp. 2201CG5-10]MDY8138318.1 glyoxalase [Aquimarina sp. 2201CG5-10]
MENRETNLLAMRPQILNARVSDNMSRDEQFQNKTIRPIIKLQNDLLIAVFKNYIGKRKNTFYDLTLEKRMLFIENAVQKDMKFRNSLKGMIIGQFTVEEYAVYIKNSSALNKRMMNIVKERLQSNIQLLEKDIAC